MKYLIRLDEHNKVVDLILNPPPNLDGIYIDELPNMEINDNEIVWLYYENGNFRIEKELR